MTQSPSNTLTGRISKDVTLTGDVVLDAAVFIEVSFQSARLIYSAVSRRRSRTAASTKPPSPSKDRPQTRSSFINAMAPANTGMRDIAMGLLPAMKP